MPSINSCDLLGATVAWFCDRRCLVLLFFCLIVGHFLCYRRYCVTCVSFPKSVETDELSSISVLIGAEVRVSRRSNTKGTSENAIFHDKLRLVGRNSRSPTRGSLP